MKISQQVSVLLPLHRDGGRHIASKNGGLPIEVYPGFIGHATAEELESLIVTAVNSHQVLVKELTAAEQIILALLNNMTTAQKSMVHIELVKAGLAGEGMTRYHERRTALELAGAV